MVKSGRLDVEHPVISWADVALTSSRRRSKAIPAVTLRGSVFNRPVNSILLHQVVRWQRAKRRKGTASVKTKAEVSGGGRKPHRQKGTGRARQGSIRSPHMRGGGANFGPKPRSFAFKLPKRTRRAGLMAALSARVKGRATTVVDTLRLEGTAALDAVARYTSENVSSFQRLDTMYVKQARFRADVLAAVDDDRLFEGPVEGDGGDGELTHRPLTGDVIVQNVRRALRNAEDPSSLLLRTAWVAPRLKALLPRGYYDLPVRQAQANEIVSRLNVGFHEERIAHFEKKRKPQPRLNMLIIVGDEEETLRRELRMSTSNIPGVTVLPVKGANVYDVLRHRHLVMTLAAVDGLTTRLTLPPNRGFKPAAYSRRQWLDSMKERREQEQRQRAANEAWIAQLWKHKPTPGLVWGWISQADHR